MAPELIYFEGTGRAAITRMIFTLGKVEFKDTYIGWAQHQKNKEDLSHPVGQKYGSMPVLVDGDVVVAQSLAIATYAAEVALPGHNDLTPLQRALDNDFLHTCLGELLTGFYKCIFGSDESKAASKEALPSVVEKFFSKIEPVVAKRGEGHFTHGGDKPSLGDLAIFDIVHKLNSLKADLAKYPCIRAIYAKVEALEGVKAVYKIA